MDALRPLTLTLVAVGSATGGLMRHVVTEAAVGVAGASAPVATLALNVVGSVAAGVVVGLVAQGWPIAWTVPAGHAAMTGLLGGFTTFSAFSAHSLTLLQAGRLVTALVYMVASVTLAVAGCWVGFALTSASSR